MMPVTGQTTKDELNITYRMSYRILSFSNNARNKIFTLFITMSQSNYLKLL